MGRSRATSVERWDVSLGANEGRRAGVRTTLNATGPADPAEVWERYAEPARWSQWSPQVRHVSTHERIRAGLRGRVDLLLPFRVESVDERNRRWSWQAGPLHLVHTVDPDPAGTRTTLTVVGPPPFVVPYLPLAQLALRRLVA